MCNCAKIRSPNTGSRMTVKVYLDRAAKAEEPCEHGHIGCAAWEGGPCSDELLSKHPELAD